MTSISRLASILLATAATAALAAPALADNTTRVPFEPGPLLGGGYIGTGGFGAAPTQTVAARLSADRTQLDFYAVVEVPCGDGGSYAASPTGYNVPLAADGKFAGSVPYETSGPGGSRSGTFTYSGKVTTAGVATGTARLRMTMNQNGRDPVECDTKSFKWVARDSDSKPGSGTLRKKASYYGTTSDTHVAAFRVDRDAKNVAAFVFDQGFDQSQCSNGQIIDPSNISLFGFKIKNGKFSGKRVLNREFGDTDVKFEFRISGKFGKSRASGGVSYAITSSRGGSVVSRCESGPLTWKAER